MKLRNIKTFLTRHRTLILSLTATVIVFLILWPKTATRRHVKPTREKVLYNLMEENRQMSQHVKDCNLEYVNGHKLQQDHPCVLQIIRNQFLKSPPPRNTPLNLDYPEKVDMSAGQATAVQRILRNLTGGFFVECGAADGELFSNTILLEREMNWTGVLIEPDPKSYSNLAKRNRQASVLPVCLSLEKYPTEVSFEKNYIIGKIQGDKVSQKELEAGKLVNVQCFPLYSILLAQGRTNVDFFSLDVEGHELAVLKTIPWDKVNVTMMVVEWEHVEEGLPAIVDYMTEQGFVNFGNIATPYARDVVFVRDFLQDLRYDYGNYD